MKQNEDQNTKRALAKLFIQKQLADWSNVLEILEDIDSLERTVKIQEAKIKELENSIAENDVNYLDGQLTETDPILTFGGEGGPTLNLVTGHFSNGVFSTPELVNPNFSKRRVTPANGPVILPVRSAPKVFESIEDIEAAHDALNMKAARNK